MLNPDSCAKVVVRATNWVGDAVMSLPAIRAIRGVFPRAELAVLARPWVADLYAWETGIDRVIPYPGGLSLREKLAFSQRLRQERFDAAILLQNAFDAALITWMARIPVRIGYGRDARGFLLTHSIPVPGLAEIPRHQRFYYLELLRRAGLIPAYPECAAIRLAGMDAARESGSRGFEAAGMAGDVIGVSPGAAYGEAKRWPAESFAQAAAALARRTGASVAVFGSAVERPLCQAVTDALAREAVTARNFAGETPLRQFIAMAAACRLFLTNDSGAMHIASAAGVPTVTVFGATDDVATGPTGPLARIVRAHAECSPCLLRACPIDHRCMTRVTPEMVVAAATQLLEETAWTRAAKS